MVAADPLISGGGDSVDTTDADVDAVLASSQATTAAPVVSPAADADPEPVLDPRFAKLRDQAIANQKLAEATQERLKRAEELEQKYVPPKGLQAKLKAMGYEKIEDLLEEYARTGGEPDPNEERLSATDKKLEELLKRDRDREQAAAQAQAQAQVAKLRTDIDAHIKSVPDLELLQEPGGLDDVYSVMETHYQNTFDPSTGRGEVLPIASAAKHVNKVYLERAARLAKYATVQKLVGAPTSKSPVQAGAASQKPAQIKTITNDIRGGAQPKAELSDDELFQDVVSNLQKAMQNDRLR